MVNASLRTLAVAAIAAFALGPGPAAAVTQLNSCAALTKAGETYVLTADVSAHPSVLNGVCFRIDADRITLDLGGHTITGLGTDGGVCVWDGGSRVNTVIRNGTLTDCGWGILLAASTRTTVRNVTAVENFHGIEIGSDSLVKDCTVQRNLGNGILIGDRGQVENCVVGDAEPGAGVDGNGFNGIASGGQRVLVTRTTSNGNGAIGILLGSRGTVSHSTASHNGDDGISISQNGLLTRNTASDNGSDGIVAVCPSTITHNTALGNNGEDIFTLGPNCVVLHNVTSPVGCLTGGSELADC